MPRDKLTADELEQLKRFIEDSLIDEVSDEIRGSSRSYRRA
jgi:hypothetical protein